MNNTWFVDRLKNLIFLATDNRKYYKQTNQAVPNDVEAIPPTIELINSKQNPFPAWLFKENNGFIFYGKADNDKLLPHTHSYTTRNGAPVYVSAQNGGMYITIGINGNIQGVQPNAVVKVVQQPIIAGMGQPTGGIPNINTGTVATSTPVLHNMSTDTVTTNTQEVTPIVQQVVVTVPQQSVSNEPMVGSFPNVLPLVIKRRRETVEIDDTNNYILGYFKDYERDQLMEERLFYNKKLILQNAQYNYLYELNDNKEVRDKDGAVVTDILLWDEGYSTNDDDAIFSILDLNDWSDIAREISNLKDTLLQKYLNSKITVYLNNKLRFLGIKYYNKSGGYYRVMIKSFMDTDTGYDKFISQLENSIFNESHKSYDKVMKNRVKTTLTESLIALKTAIKDMPDFEVAYLPELQTLLDDSSATPVVIPVFVKVICLYTESVTTELEKLEIGDSRNVTPSETITRLLHHIDNKDDRDISMYDYRILTDNCEFDIQRYKNETVVTRIK